MSYVREERERITNDEKFSGRTENLFAGLVYSWYAAAAINLKRENDFRTLRVLHFVPITRNVLLGLSRTHALNGLCQLISLLFTSLDGEKRETFQDD